MHDRPMWETVDPDGRRVVLSFGAWRHIVGRHPELSPHREKILKTVTSPHVLMGGRELNEVWYFGRGFGPSRSVRVVVHYEHELGRIRTAFPQRELP